VNRRLLAGAVAALALVAGAPGASAEDTLKLAVGQRGNWDTSISEVGQLAGIFKKHGLMLEIVYTSGAGETQQAVISGSVDIGVAAGHLLLHLDRAAHRIDDAAELVLHRDRLIDPEDALVDRGPGGDHHRHLHRAGGVKFDVGLNQELVATVEAPKRHRDVGPAAGNDLLDFRADWQLSRADADRRGKAGDGK